MASRASKFDSKKAVPGARDTTRLRKSFRPDSRGELGSARNTRGLTFADLNFSRFISLRLMFEREREREEEREKRREEGNKIK